MTCNIWSHSKMLYRLLIISSNLMSYHETSTLSQAKRIALYPPLIEGTISLAFDSAMSRKKMAPDLKTVGLLALIIYTKAVSATIFEPASPLNIIPDKLTGGKLESEVFESTDSEILRRDLFNENWDANARVDTVYGGPYDFLWFEKDKDNDVGSGYLQGANSTLRLEFDVQHHLEF